MTTEQKRVLYLIKTRKVIAFCDKCVWHFRNEDGEVINRRTIYALEKSGMVKISYYSDGVAGVKAA